MTWENIGLAGAAESLVKLFASPDRAIRVALLQHIDSFGTAISPTQIEDQVSLQSPCGR